MPRDFSLDHASKTDSGILLIDDRVWSIWERVEDKPMWGAHRYQYIVIRRGEREHLYVKDLGPEVLFPNACQWNFWAANEYSIGEAVEIGERLREGKDPEPREPTDLGAAFMNQQEEKRALRAHRTTSGPFITISRN